MNKLQENLNSVFDHYSNYLNELDKKKLNSSPSLPYIITVNDSILINITMNHWIMNDRINIFVNASVMSTEDNDTLNMINDDCYVGDVNDVMSNSKSNSKLYVHFDMNDTIDLNDNPKFNMFKGGIITRVRLI